MEPYLDGELDASISATVREHLASCPSCEEPQRRLIALRAGIRSQAPYFRAPARLSAQIGTALRGADRQAFTPWRWVAIAASLLLAVSLAWNVTSLVTRSSRAGLFAQNIISSHIHSLMGTHLLDIPSSDRHTVKPWFNGKLDFSPEVRDFATEGFPLLGGRLDYIDGHPAAALVYQRRQHVINVFTWPSSSTSGETELSANGYHAVYWSSSGMTYWAVSDLRAGELRQFVNLYNPTSPPK